MISFIDSKQTGMTIPPKREVNLLDRHSREEDLINLTRERLNENMHKIMD